MLSLKHEHVHADSDSATPSASPFLIQGESPFSSKARARDVGSTFLTTLTLTAVSSQCQWCHDHRLVLGTRNSDLTQLVSIPRLQIVLRYDTSRLCFLKLMIMTTHGLNSCHRRNLSPDPLSPLYNLIFRGFISPNVRPGPEDQAS